MISTEKVSRKYDLYCQYDVYMPWLVENGFALKDLPLTAKTECGEDVVVDAYYNDSKQLIWKISTIQSNGWVRVHHYHPDGAVEEYFEK